MRGYDIAFKSTGAFLLLKLPSGRKLSYPQPRVVGDEQRQHVVFADNAAGQFKDCRNGQGAYGGLWVENIRENMQAGALILG